MRRCQRNFVHIVNINTSIKPTLCIINIKIIVVLLLIYIDITYIIYLTSSIILYIFYMTHMDKNIPSDSDSKKAALRSAGALHPDPNAVRDEAFVQDDFFDSNDLMQVKYEMLRRHREDQKTVAEVARAFGTSRQSFYSAKALFDSQGIPGLIPKRRGPRGAHKCTEEVLDFAEQWKSKYPAEGTVRLSEVIEQHFGIRINPRSIDRALFRRKKKRQLRTETPE
jgi:transposase